MLGGLDIFYWILHDRHLPLALLALLQLNQLHVLQLHYFPYKRILQNITLSQPPALSLKTYIASWILITGTGCCFKVTKFASTKQKIKYFWDSIGPFWGGGGRWWGRVDQFNFELFTELYRLGCPFTLFTYGSLRHSHSFSWQSSSPENGVVSEGFVWHSGDERFISVLYQSVKLQRKRGEINAKSQRLRGQ